jgi:hypothetical protein
MLNILTVKMALREGEIITSHYATPNRARAYRQIIIFSGAHLKSFVIV